MTIKMSRKLKKPSKVVVSGEMKQHRFVALLKKFWLVVVGVLLVIAIVAGIYARYQTTHKTPAKVVATTTCSDSSANGILNKATPVLVPSKVAELQPIAEKIMTLQGYDRDPNCLGVVTTYYINLSDAAKARENYEKLIKVYPTAKGYNEALGGKVATPTELKPTIEFLEARAKDIRDNNQKNGASNAR